MKGAVDRAEEAARKFKQQLKDASDFAGNFMDELLVYLGQDEQTIRLKVVADLAAVGNSDALEKKLREAMGLQDVLGNAMLEQQELAYSQILNFGNDSPQAQIARDYLTEASDKFRKQHEYVQAINQALDDISSTNDERELAAGQKRQAAKTARESYAEDLAQQSGNAEFFRSMAAHAETEANAKFGKWGAEKLGNGAGAASEEEIAARRQIDRWREISNLLESTKSSKQETANPSHPSNGDRLTATSDRWARVGAFVGGTVGVAQLEHARATAKATAAIERNTQRMAGLLERLEPATL